MESVDLEQQWRELRETYGRMTEEELRSVAEDAFDLTQVAREALQSVIAEKKLNVQLAEAPPPAEFKGVGNSKEEFDLSVVCEVKSEADAKRAKGILDAKFIASCLGPENIADLENFKGSFAGGVDVKVFPEDAIPARRAVNQDAPDLMRWDGDPEDEDELDYAVTCPKCQSRDIILEETDVPLEYALRPEYNCQWRKARWTCAACGHQWQDEGIAHIIDKNARDQSSSSD